jgi:hypothetical protein
VLDRNPLSDRFALSAALLLLALVLTNDARWTLAGSLVGLAAGLWVAARGSLTRVAIIAAIALALALGFAVFQLIG